MDDSDHHASDFPPSQDHAHTQMHAQQEEGHLSHKKQKANITRNTNTLTEDDVQELVNAVAKVAQDNLASLRTQQLNIATKVEGHLNKLIEAIQDVKATMEAKTYGVDPSVPLVTPTLVPPIRVLIQR